MLSKQEEPLHQRRDLLPDSAETVHGLIEAHVAICRRLPESARLRDLGAERALVQDYSGRVVFELLQNALDRASHEVEVRWDPECRILEVANDGRAICGPEWACPGKRGGGEL